MTLIADLVSLHRVDSQVRALRGRLESAQHYVSMQERQRLLLQGRLDEIKSQTRQYQATAANQEAESGTIKARVESLRTQLNTSTNPKQYAAVLNELKVLQSKRDEVDDSTLAQLQKVEELQAKLLEIEKLLAERIQVKAAGSVELEICRAEVGSRLAELDAERTAAAARIPQRDRDAFNRVADLYEGEAMAELVAVDVGKERDYVCGVCNMELPKDKYAALASNQNIAVTCTSCHRILYIQEAAAAAS